MYALRAKYPNPTRPANMPSAIAPVPSPAAHAAVRKCSCRYAADQKVRQNSDPAPRNIPRQYTQKRGARTMAADFRRISGRGSALPLSGYSCPGRDRQRKSGAEPSERSPATPSTARHETPSESSPPASKTAAPMPTDQKLCAMLT